VPTAIAGVAGHDAVALVWQNELGGVTARIDRPGGSVFAKWDPSGSPASLLDETERMRWLGQAGMAVPRVIELRSGSAGDVLVTEAIDAESVVSAAGLRDPERAAAALGVGLRRLHALPVSDCPFPAPSWSASERLDDPVVCHGDPCAPNTLIANGRFAALVDLGDVGVGDRWSDLAIASWSLEWNGLGDAEPAFWDAYGARRDERRLARWRALWVPPIDQE
jgi:kanamycin kinase